MLVSLPGFVSNRGQWRGSRLLVTPDGLSDLGSATFAMTVRDFGDQGCARPNYGFLPSVGSDRTRLSASTDDGTSRFTVVPLPGRLACAWLFPADAMLRLPDGAYEASISVNLGGESSELDRLSFAVR